VTTQPCVSPGTGTISPDLRVFYQYGMVLGLNDFLQEQTHNLGLDYHHERALHGYGTVYGLRVTASTPLDAPDDVTLTVEPGMAIDQQGREVTVPSAQCARLGAWLAAQEEATQGTIKANLGPSGELVVYVVAAYSECADDLVPLPGQPCSTSAQAQVPSRLRDAWDIELRWAPPPMPAWDVVRQLAALLNSVQVVPGLAPSLSSEQAIIEAVLALTSPATPSDAPSMPGPYQLPQETADEAFDRIFTVWVTQVRPQLAPDLTAPDPAWDPSILLSAITLLPEMPFSVSNPVISWYSDPDDTGRPYLLQTELIQELRLGGTGGSAAVSLVQQQAVTLSATADLTGAPTLTAWFHVGQPVSLPGTISVVDGNSADQNAAAVQFTTTPVSGTPFSQVWTLSPPANYTVTDGDQLAATFPGTGVLVGDNGTTLVAATAGLGFLDTTIAGDVTAYAAVPVPAPPASTEFVTVTYVPPSPAAGASLQMWFHLDRAGVAGGVVMATPSVEVYLDNAPGTRVYPPLFGPTPAPTELAPNIWSIPLEEAKPPAHLRLIFPTGDTQVTAPQVISPIGQPVPLADWIAFSGMRYLGWEGNNIVSYALIETTITTEE
jgi:hypothetical protein